MLVIHSVCRRCLTAEFRKAVAYGQEERQAGKARDHDAVGQHYAQFVEGKLRQRLSHIGEVARDQQKGRHEEYEDDFTDARVEGAKVDDVHQDDHQYEYGSQEVYVVICLSFHVLCCWNLLLVNKTGSGSIPDILRQGNIHLSPCAASDDSGAHTGPPAGRPPGG